MTPYSAVHLRSWLIGFPRRTTTLALHRLPLPVTPFVKFSHKLIGFLALFVSVPVSEMVDTSRRHSLRSMCATWNWNAP